MKGEQARLRIITHHFLYQKRYWNNGWAKKLRDYYYCGAYIERAHLHRDIHSTITQVFVPNGNVCKRVHEDLQRMTLCGRIDQDDPPWVKLEVLAALLEDDCPITAQILRWQRSKILKFYRAP